MDFSFGAGMTAYYRNLLAGQLTGGTIWGNSNALNGNVLFGDVLTGNTVTAAPAYLNFSSALEKALGKSQTFREGEDVIMGFPPAYNSNYEADESKDTSEMSLEEYKQYICSKISGMPVSSSMRMNCHGMLVLKEEAFISMQKDSAYEEKILNMLQKGFQTEYPFYAPNVGCQVIGGSEAECYGVGLPIKNGSDSYEGEEKSWWEQRHESAEDYVQMGQRGSLAVRLEQNRESRKQQRIAAYQRGAGTNKPKTNAVDFEWSI